jgi:hypothetical protein
MPSTKSPSASLGPATVAFSRPLSNRVRSRTPRLSRWICKSLALGEHPAGAACHCPHFSSPKTRRRFGLHRPSFHHRPSLKRSGMALSLSLWASSITTSSAGKSAADLPTMLSLVCRGFWLGPCHRIGTVSSSAVSAARIAQPRPTGATRVASGWKIGRSSSVHLLVAEIRGLCNLSQE